MSHFADTKWSHNKIIQNLYDAYTATVPNNCDCDESLSLSLVSPCRMKWCARNFLTVLRTAKRRRHRIVAQVLVVFFFQFLHWHSACVCHWHRQQETTNKNIQMRHFCRYLKIFGTHIRWTRIDPFVECISHDTSCRMQSISSRSSVCHCSMATMHLVHLWCRLQPTSMSLESALSLYRRRDAWFACFPTTDGKKIRSRVNFAQSSGADRSTRNSVPRNWTILYFSFSAESNSK